MQIADDPGLAERETTLLRRRKDDDCEKAVLTMTAFAFIFLTGSPVTAYAGKKSVTVKKLKAGKLYYVRIRTWKKAGSKIYYSKWSKVKKIKTK